MVKSDWYKFEFEKKNNYETALLNLQYMKEVLVKAHNYLDRKMFIHGIYELDSNTKEDVILLCLAVTSDSFRSIKNEVELLEAEGHIV